MKITLKELLFNIAVPVVLGFIVSLLNDTNSYQTLIKPALSPPKVLFPIAWTILYILMGISSYIISNKENNNKAIVIYYISLIINLLWSFFFFTFKLYLFSSIWLFLLIIFVVLMIINYYKLDKPSAYLQIPYLLWILFAFYLNISIYILN